MNSIAAGDIAVRLTNAWPRSSITVKAWTEELIELDRARAEETMRRLIRTTEHAPTIAAFLTVYRALAGTAKDEPCALCAGSGWVTDTNHPAHWPGRPETIPKIPDHYGPGDGCLCNCVTHCPACRPGTQPALL